MKESIQECIKREIFEVLVDLEQSIGEDCNYKTTRKNILRIIPTNPPGTIENDFESGVYFHATGTGKSWIALEILLNY